MTKQPTWRETEILAQEAKPKKKHLKVKHSSKCQECGGSGFILSTDFTADDISPSELECPACKPHSPQAEEWGVLDKILEDCSDNVINGAKEWIRQDRQKQREDRDKEILEWAEKREVRGLGMSNAYVDGNNEVLLDLKDFITKK